MPAVDNPCRVPRALATLGKFIADTLIQPIYVCTINSMDITFDAAKDAANRAKHGLSLAQAGKLEWESALVWTDERSDYGEERQCALGLIGNRMHFVAFVDRPDTRRIISLRRANARETRRYAEND